MLRRILPCCALLLVLGSSCTDREKSLLEPTPSEVIVELGNWSASIWYFDSQSADGRVRLEWRTGRKGWIPGPQFPGDPAPTPPPAVGRVCVLMSELSPETGFSCVATHQQDGPDSAWVDGLINKRPYYFRLATYDSASDTLIGHSAPLMTTPAPWPDRVQVVAKALPSAEYFTAAAWSPDGGQLAYVRATDQGPNGYESNICVFDVASGDDRQLTLYEGSEHFLGGPTWSSDGSFIAYFYSPTRTSGGVDYRVWRTLADSFAPTAITAGRIDSHPAWGPSGELVFCRGTWGPPNIPELWIATPDSWTARQLTSDQLSRKRFPSVNPQSGVIVFQGEDVNSYKVHLYTIDPNGGISSPLTSEHHWEEREPMWVADGRRVVFTSERSGHPEIWMYDTVSGEYLQLTRGPELLPKRSVAALSPDGSLIAYRQEPRYGFGALLIAPIIEP